MSDFPAKVNITLKDKTFEISGSETFVASQMAILKDAVFHLFSQPYNESGGCSEETLAESQESTGVTKKNDSLGKNFTCYENVLDCDQGTVKIIADVPGDSNREKSMNIALIYLWAKKSFGIDEIRFDEIRDACEEHGCLDSGNFSKHMRALKGSVIIGGTEKQLTGRITVPGSKAAEALIKELNSK